MNEKYSEVYDIDLCPEHLIEMEYIEKVCSYEDTEQEYDNCIIEVIGEKYYCPKCDEFYVRYLD